MDPASDGDRAPGVLVGARDLLDRADLPGDPGREAASSAAAGAADRRDDVVDQTHAWRRLGVLRGAERPPGAASPPRGCRSPTHGARGARSRTTRIHAEANRRCTASTCARSSPCFSSSASISATTTATGPDRSHPSALAWMTTLSWSPARPTRMSRRNSARYLVSTIATSWSLVSARAAIRAARSRRCRSAGPRSRAGRRPPGGRGRGARRDVTIVTHQAACARPGRTSTDRRPRGSLLHEEPPGPVEAAVGLGGVEVGEIAAPGQDPAVGGGGEQGGADVPGDALAEVAQRAAGDHRLQQVPVQCVRAAQQLVGEGGVVSPGPTTVTGERWSFRASAMGAP